MQKKIIWAVGALALGVSVYVGSTLWAQQGGGAAPVAPVAPSQPHTRIAFVNLAYILKNYHKVSALSEDMKRSFAEYESRAKQKQGEMERLSAENQKPETAAAKREQNLQTLTTLKREIEDINNMAKKVLGDKSDANAVTLYREIQDAAARYALANNFDMVLQFLDAYDEKDYNTPMNIMSKMQTRACFPLYYQGGNDISFQVLTALDEAYKKVNPAAFSIQQTGGTAPKGN